MTANKISAFALGFGSGLTAADRSFLDPIAYDGRNDAPRDALVVQSFADLDTALAASIRPTAVGNLIQGGLGGAIGADLPGFVKSITVDNVTFTYDPLANNGAGSLVTSGTGGATGTFATSTNSLTITTALKNSLLIDMDDGVFTYSGNPTATLPPGGIREVFSYVISDRDGDTTGSDLTITTPNPFLRATDAQPNVNGTGNADIIVGNAAINVLNGGDGNDDIYGGGGNDTLNGGNGNDRLYGGSGNDTLIGGAGSDVFAWRFGDQGVTREASGSSTGFAVDRINDFDAVRTVAQGGDVLDLRDLLYRESKTVVGTAANPLPEGHLERYLDFDTSGADTVIRISSKGLFTSTSDTFTPGTTSVNGQQVDQTITLVGVKLDVALGLAANSSDALIINRLLSDGKLITD